MRGPGRFPLLSRVYRLLLYAYPRRFREAYGPDLVVAFQGRCARARADGRLPGLLAWIARAVLDVLWNGLMERWSGWSSRSGHGGPSVGAPVSPPGKGDVRAGVVRDLRFAFRLLVRQPGLTATLVLTLSVGTGATTALFSVLDAALLRPLPYPESERLMLVHRVSEEFGTYGFGIPDLRDLRERVSGIEPLVGFTSTWDLTLTGPGAPRRVDAAYVSDGAFPLLGVAPVQGRTFDAGEHTPGGPRAAVVGLPFWNRHFGAGTTLAAQTLTLDGEVHAVVGVVPAFTLPLTASVVSRDGTPAELWLPLEANPLAAVRAVPAMNVIGRLGAGGSEERVRAELAAVGRALAADHPETGDGSPVRLTPLEEAVTADVRRTVLTLFAASAFLLLIACVNVANLLLARSTVRRQEMALRLSLGAGRRQLVQQLLCESLVVGVLGSAAGVALAWAVLAGIPPDVLPLPPSAEVGMDGRVVAFAILLSLGTTGAFGLLPALQTVPGAAARDGARSTGGGGRLRNALVAAEAALAVTLLVGAGLFARSFWNLVRVDPGFRAESLLQVPVAMGESRYPSADARRTFLEELLPALSALPGVSGVAAVNRLPLGGGNVLVGVETEAGPPSDGSVPTLDRRVATPGYFQLMGIPVVEGREFAAEDAQGRPTAMVNEAFVRRFWPGSSGLGRRLRLMLRGGPGPWLDVVGVAGDVRHHGLGRPPEPEVYVPFAQAPVEGMTVVLRASDPSGVLPAVRGTVWEIDPDLPLDDAGPVAEIVGSSVEEPRLRALVVNGFALLALLLAAIGIYGVMSYSVAQRTRETGVRIALGARRIDVLRGVVGEALRSTGVGLVVGLMGAWALGRLVGSLLYGVEPTDPSTYIGVAALLLAVTAAASYLPARRATRVDPVIAIRGD